MGVSHAHGRIIIEVDMQMKNSHTFSDGTVIRLERDYNNLNRRYTQPVQGKVLSADNIPVGAMVLIHHNSLHDTNRLFNYRPLSGTDIASDLRFFSIPEIEAYLWQVPGEEWKPIDGFVTALRVFEPYRGVIQGIPPKLLQDILYITSEGQLKGHVVMTLKSCDYEIVFQDNGKENRVIRLRHSDTEDLEREEVILVHNDFTKKVNAGELLLGLTPSDAKPLHEKEIA